MNRLPRITVTCAGRIPSVELAAIIPLTQLQKQGLCEFRYKDETFLSAADIAWCDILLVVRGASSQSRWAARQAKKLHRIVLGFWDDDFLCVPSYLPTSRYYSSPEVQSSMSALFKLTDAFFSPNPKLAAKLSIIHGTKVEVLPVVLGTDHLEPPRRKNPAIPVLGYAGNLGHTVWLSSFLPPVLEAVASTGSDFQIHIVGAKPDLGGKVKAKTTYTPQIEDYYAYLAFASKLDWDIGLAPQSEGEHTTYKFYNKLLEYTHIGCAGIYSKLEPYSLVIQDGITGLLVPNEVAAWRDAILRLAGDPDLRFRIVSNACEFVRSHHSWAVIAERYAVALAPFLAYRAPDVSKVYIITRDLAGRPLRFWQMLRHYTKGYGFRYVLGPARRYALALLRQRRS